MNAHEQVKKDIIEQRDKMVAQNKKQIIFFKKMQSDNWKDKVMKGSLNDIILDLEQENERLEDERTRS